MAIPGGRDGGSAQGVGLDRAIGSWTLGASAVNLSLGAGIFALPAAVAAILGPAAILAYLVCGLAIALVLICFVEIGSQTTRSGGTVAFIEDGFGPMAGFVAWVVYTLAYCAAADAAISLVFIGAITPLVPALQNSLVRALTLVALFGGLAAINILGVRHGARVAVATTIVKLLPIVSVVCAGLVAMHWSELRWRTWPTVPKLGEASLLLFFAYSGAEAALTPGGEIRDPQKTIPRGIIGGTIALVVVYASVQLVSQGILGAELSLHSDTALAAVSGRIFGPAGWSLIVACMALAIFGTLAADMLASPRGFLPVAADGLLPPAFARIHSRFRTPYVAIASFAALTCVIAISGAFKPLAILSSGSLLLVYFFVCLAALKLRLTRQRPAGSFRAPGGPIVPIAGMITVAWLLAQSTSTEAIALAGLVLLAGSYYLLRQRWGRPGRAA